jgi:hypothetical protein
MFQNISTQVAWGRPQPPKQRARLERGELAFRRANPFDNFLSRFVWQFQILSQLWLLRYSFLLELKIGYKNHFYSTS